MIFFSLCILGVVAFWRIRSRGRNRRTLRRYRRNHYADVFVFLISLGIVGSTQAQYIDNAGLASRKDSTAIHTNIGGGAEQIERIEVQLTYIYGQGDTLHASPGELARGRYALMDSSGNVILRSRWIDLMQVPNRIFPLADKRRARAFMNALRDAIINRNPDLGNSQ